MSQIEIHDLRIEYRKPQSGESFVAVDNVSLNFEPGEFITIVGSSGCGKSTLLLAVAGLVQTSAGSVEINGVGTPAETVV